MFLLIIKISYFQYFIEYSVVSNLLHCHVVKIEFDSGQKEGQKTKRFPMRIDVRYEERRFISTPQIFLYALVYPVRYFVLQAVSRPRARFIGQSR